LYSALQSINPTSLKALAKEQTDLILKKIASGAEDHKSMKDYVKFLMKKFDGNSDGILTFDELISGMKQIHINLSLKEKV
jgi:hypothetical protein